MHVRMCEYVCGIQVPHSSLPMNIIRLMRGVVKWFGLVTLTFSLDAQVELFSVEF